MKSLWLSLAAVSLLQSLPAAAQLGGTVPNWPVPSGGPSELDARLDRLEVLERPADALNEK